MARCHACNHCIIGEEKVYLSGPVSYRDFRETGPRDENQQQTQPTYDAETGNRTWATLVGGECSHHCAIPAPCDLESDSRQRIEFCNFSGQQIQWIVTKQEKGTATDHCTSRDN